MTRCPACGAMLVGTRCGACSPEPQHRGEPRPPDRQQELGWQFFTRFGWRNAALAVPILVGASLYLAVFDRDTGGSVFFALGAIAYGVYGVVKWSGEHRR